MKQLRQSGFSLIEMIMVSVIIAMASIPILGQFTQVASSSVINEDIQTAAQLAQERAEDILALRRDQGYAAVIAGTTIDVLTGNYASFSRSVTVTEPSALGGCSSGASCKGVVVTVNRGLSKRAEVAYVLVDY